MHYTMKTIPVDEIKQKCDDYIACVKSTKKIPNLFGFAKHLGLTGKKELDQYLDMDEYHSIISRALLEIIDTLIQLGGTSRNYAFIIYVLKTMGICETNFINISQSNMTHTGFNIILDKKEDDKP